MKNQSREIEIRVVDAPTDKMLLSRERQSLIEEHVNFCQMLTRKFYRSKKLYNFDLNDLTSVAMIGLCHAAARYDETRNGGFKAFAKIRIIGSIVDYLRASDGSPAYSFAGMGVFKPWRLRGHMNEDEECVVDRRFNGIGFGVNEEWGVKVYSESDPANAELSYLVHKSPEEEAEQNESFKYIIKLIGHLPEEERKILILCYVEDKSLREIGKEIRDVSKSWVSRVHSRAIDRLRDLFEENECRCSLNMVRHALR